MDISAVMYSVLSFSRQLLAVSPQTDDDFLNLWSGPNQEIGTRNTISSALASFSLLSNLQTSNRLPIPYKSQSDLLRLNRSTPRARREKSKCRNTKEGNQ